ncbi:hypothetical protein JCM3775_005847 [Rhodotorula graminis]|uniref:DASH complex subunit DAD3 n=1 Tax=Rhodotorula graminis (strain WP1) TaxID=578459 RepID=A0A194S3H6_RHOGW|nr:uncharacterized protein RHOBADRAFT_43779 [Rhodotorula graminis WP1]KPV75288.1 hypothetical protein RHOBADRAFT_43779 [Rhodotorula graminis WP1]
MAQPASPPRPAADLIHQLELQVLQEYSATARNLDDIATVVQRLSAAQPQILSELRPLERKLGLILTLFKASVWSVLRQREDAAMYEEEQQQ